MLPIILMNVAIKKSFTLTWVALTTTIHTDTLPVWSCNAHSQTKPAHKVPSAWNVAHPTPHLCFLWANSQAYFKSRINAYVKLEYNFHECPPCAWLCPECLECSRPSLNTFWNNESIYQNILEKTEPKKQKKYGFPTLKQVNNPQKGRQGTRRRAQSIPLHPPRWVPCNRGLTNLWARSYLGNSEPYLPLACQRLSSTEKLRPLNLGSSPV